MEIQCIFLALTIIGVSGQTWVNRAKLTNFTEYFTDVIQHTIYEVEKREWCNLKIEDYTVIVNEHMYRWHVSGNVTYANGFLISIQKIELTNIESLFTSPTVNGTVQATGAVRGLVNFRDSNIGFDVIVKLDDGSEQRYTGNYTYNSIRFRASIFKNFHTGEITTSIDLTDPGTGAARMTFMPANNVTEVLSRRTYVPSRIYSSVRAWQEDVFHPILQKFATTKMEFPSVCFVNC